MMGIITFIVVVNFLMTSAYYTRFIRFINDLIKYPSLPSCIKGKREGMEDNKDGI
jgi:hypothetical protein